MSQSDASSVSEASVGLVPTESTILIGILSFGWLAVVGIVEPGGWFGFGGAFAGLLLAVGIARVSAAGWQKKLIGGVSVLLGAGLAGSVLAAQAISHGLPSTSIPLGGFLVGFGLGTFRLDAYGEGAIARTVGWGLRVSMMVGGLAGLIVLLSLESSVIVGGLGIFLPLGRLLSPVNETGIIVGFVVMSWLAFLSVYAVVYLLPSSSIFSGRVRTRYRLVRDWAFRLAAIVFGLGSLALGITGIILVATGIGTNSLQPVIMGILGAPGLRMAILRVVLIGGLTAGLVGLLRTIGLPVVLGRPDWLPAGLVVTLAVFLLALLEGVFFPHFVVNQFSQVAVIPESTITAIGGPALIGVTATIGIFGLSSVLGFISILSGSGLLRPSEAGPRLVLLGTLLTAIVILISGSPNLGFTGIALAVFLWKLTDYGATLIQELGPNPARLNGQFVHAGGSLVVALATVIEVWAITVVVRLLEPTPPGHLAGIGLAIGALLVVSVGYAISERGVSTNF